MDTFKKRLLTESGITVAVIAALILGITFLSGTITDYGTQIVTMRNQLAAHSNSLNSLASLRTQYSSVVNKDLQIMNSVVPIKDQLINLTKEFQLLASQKGLSSSFVFVSELPATASSLGTVRFRLEITGNFEKLVSFVTDLQNFKYLSTFDTYSIIRTTSDDGELKTSGQIYFRQ